MCGLTGIIDTKQSRSAESLRVTVTSMAGAIQHRGPDDFGEWVDASAGVAFGFRRLSIIDLSAAGHQPMVSDSGRWVIIYNGEVYNFESIRKELIDANLAPSFRGHSDTEVMLAAIEAWGVTAAVKRFVGMFAIALWDRRDRTLYLIRDRVGVKPLHFGWCGDVLLFGSELKSFRRVSDFKAEINRDSVALFMRHNHVPAPYTIYTGIEKVLPGTVVVIPEGKRDRMRVETYWSAKEVAETGARNQFPGDRGEAVDELDRLLRKVVGLRMISDVPLGVFLSGGVDSSVVVAQMQAQSARRVKTFSIGFNEDVYNEAHYAAEVARHLGTDHTEMYVTPAQALDVIPKLPTLYDEPFADSSQIPTYLVSALARRHVTVALSGDGGDELFGGYTRYFLGRSLWKTMAWIPRPLRQITSNLLLAIPPQSWNAFFRRFGKVLPWHHRLQNPGHKVLRAASILSADTPEAMYRGLMSHWDHPSQIVLGSDEPPTAMTDQRRQAQLDDFTDKMMFLDLISYLPDDIMVKVDRASMGVSLEAREPLLDHRLIEFAWSLPASMKFRNGTGKWVLRQVLHRYVPSTLVERPKMGFGVPIDSWLRGPLREWAETLLDEKRLSEDNLLDPKPIREKWEDHLRGERNWQDLLWNVLVLQQWRMAQDDEAMQTGTCSPVSYSCSEIS